LNCVLNFLSFPPLLFEMYSQMIGLYMLDKLTKIFKTEFENFGFVT